MPLRTDDQFVLTELPTVLIIRALQSRIGFYFIAVTITLVIVEVAKEPRRRRPFFETVRQRHLIAHVECGRRIIVVALFDGIVQDIKRQRVPIVEAMIQSERHGIVIIVAVQVLCVGGSTASVLIRSTFADTRVDEPTELAVIALIGDLIGVTVPRAGVDINGRLIVIALLRDDVDHTADGIGTVKRRASALDDLNSIDCLHRRINESSASVNKSQHAIVAVDKIPDHAVDMR